MLIQSYDNTVQQRSPYTKKNPFTIVNSQIFVNRTIDNLETTIRSSGIPSLWWQYVGELDKTNKLCWCYAEETKQALSSCKTCWGTGYVNSYQKYGYQTLTFTGANTVLNNIKLSGHRFELLNINSGSTGNVETDWLSLDDNLEYISAAIDGDIFNAARSSMVLQYKLNDEDAWQNVPDDIDLIPLSTVQIKLRVVLSRKDISDKSPQFRHFRFRYRTKENSTIQWPEQPLLVVPTILIAREFATKKREMDARGLADKTTDRKYWSMQPIEQRDFLMTYLGDTQDLESKIYRGGDKEVHAYPDKNGSPQEYRRTFTMRAIDRHSNDSNLYNVY